VKSGVLPLENINACLELVLEILRGGRGVKTLKVLTATDKRSVLEVEEKAEKRIVYGMCRTLNQGIKEALQRDYTVAVVMDTSIFEYPHHPYMVMVYDDTIVGEPVKDLKRIDELKKDRANIFLWENFVIYTQRLPRGREAMQKLRMVYIPRAPPQLEEVACVEEGVFGTPSTEGHILLKKLLSFTSTDSLMGTYLIGFNIKRS
jgi:hypothetical protein